MKGFKPMKVKANKCGDPYVYKTRLEWYILGTRMNDNSKWTISYHYVEARDVITLQVTSHHCAKNDSIKDISL